jgi:hypothetical protein
LWNISAAVEDRDQAVRREGFIVNHKRPFRTYREERLSVRKSVGTSLCLASRCRTPSLKASTAACATNFLNEILFTSLMQARLALED